MEQRMSDNNRIHIKIPFLNYNLGDEFKYLEPSDIDSLHFSKSESSERNLLIRIENALGRYVKYLDNQNEDKILKQMRNSLYIETRSREFTKGLIQYYKTL